MLEISNHPRATRSAEFNLSADYSLNCIPLIPINITYCSSAAQVPRLNFEPTTEFPALQYFGELERGGQAEVKGVKAGDFILEVSCKIFIKFPCFLSL